MAPAGRSAAPTGNFWPGRTLRRPAGLHQFLNLGTGLPNQNNVHEVARQVHPDARVVYVDYDPVVTAHARALHPDDDITAIVEADVRKPEEILDSRGVERLIDFTQPLAVVLIGILHCLLDEEDPRGVVRAFAECMAPGSYVIISHLTDDAHPEVGVAAREIYQQASAPLVHRSHVDIARMFTGFDVVEPGVTIVSEWRPDHLWEQRQPWKRVVVRRRRPQTLMRREAPEIIVAR